VQDGVDPRKEEERLWKLFDSLDPSKLPPLPEWPDGGSMQAPDGDVPMPAPRQEERSERSASTMERELSRSEKLENSLDAIHRTLQRIERLIEGITG
jgi:hypothetical protein